MTSEATLMKAYNANKAVVLTQGTIVLVNAERFQALLDASMLASMPDGVGGVMYGIELDVNDPLGMILCEINGTRD